METRGVKKMESEDTLSSAWDQHLASEFAAKSPEQALATMTSEPYVNEIPLMIGAHGRDDVRDFYAHHFVSQIPPDTEVVPVSRTIGQGRVVDELILRFTHSIRMDWLLPGIPPTSTRMEIPMVAIVQFEGDKVAHEHIYWDQASVLVQVGLLDRTLPVRGGEIAAQVLNPTQPMNELIRRATTTTAERPLTESREGVVRAKITKVGHVVLGCRDPQASITFYTETLGMELVQFNQELQMAFFSFGERDHDIAVVKVPEGQPVGSAGLSHTALQIEGGEAELRALYHWLKDHGVKMDLTADHVLTKSVYVFDPDGKRLEIFCASMEMAAAKDYLHTTHDRAKLMAPWNLETTTT
jgi:carboxymethylenebutenolidase